MNKSLVHMICNHLCTTSSEPSWCSSRGPSDTHAASMDSNNSNNSLWTLRAALRSSTTFARNMTHLLLFGTRLLQLLQRLGRPTSCPRARLRTAALDCMARTLPWCQQDRQVPLRLSIYGITKLASTTLRPQGLRPIPDTLRASFGPTLPALASTRRPQLTTMT